MNGWETALSISLAGGLGATLRFWIDSRPFFANKPHLAILLINIAGSFILGASVGVVSAMLTPLLALALNTGFLGGFTTFSSSSLILANMVREKKFTLAGFIAVSQIIFSAIFVLLGLWFGTL